MQGVRLAEIECRGRRCDSANLTVHVVVKIETNLACGRRVREAREHGFDRFIRKVLDIGTAYRMHLARRSIVVAVRRHCVSVSVESWLHPVPLGTLEFAELTDKSLAHIQVTGENKNDHQAPAFFGAQKDKCLQLIGRGRHEVPKKPDHGTRIGNSICETACENLANRVQPILEGRYNSKISTAAANAPVKVRIRVWIGCRRVRIGRYQPRGKKVVTRRSEFSGKPAETAAQAEAGADASAFTKNWSEAVLGRGRDHRLRGYAGADPDLSLRRIDRDVIDARDVDDQALAYAPSHKAVTPGTNGELELLVTSEVDTAGDIIRGFTLHEHGWLLVRRGIPPRHTPHFVVLGVAGKNEASAKTRTELPKWIGAHCSG